MTYHGRVRPGGPAQVRELPALIITKAALGPMSNNAYLLRCRATGAALLVDAPAPVEILFDLIGEDPLATIVITHGHPDHSGGLAALANATGARVIGHAADADQLPVALDENVAHGDRLYVGEVELSVIQLRGHTPGSIALTYDDPEGRAHLFTGDSLFPGGIGNTWGDAAAFDSLIDDVEQRIFAVFDDETWVYPGHGDDTVLGRERPHLAEWRARRW